MKFAVFTDQNGAATLVVPEHVTALEHIGSMTAIHLAGSRSVYVIESVADVANVLRAGVVL